VSGVASCRFRLRTNMLGGQIAPQDLLTCLWVGYDVAAHDTFVLSLLHG